MSNVLPKRNFMANNSSFVIGADTYGLVRKVSYQDIENLLKGKKYKNGKDINNQNIKNIATNKNNKTPSKYPFVMKIFNNNPLINEIIIKNVLKIRDYVLNSIQKTYDKERFIFPLFKPIMLDLNIQGQTEKRLVTFYRNGGDSLEELSKKLNQNIKREFLHRVIFNSINGLNILHSLGITHRNIKPENIVVNENNVAFTDFNLAIILNELNENQLTENFHYCYSTQFFDFCNLTQFLIKKGYVYEFKISDFLEIYLKKLNDEIKTKTNNYLFNKSNKKKENQIIKEILDLFNISDNFDLKQYFNNLEPKLIIIYKQQLLQQEINKLQQSGGGFPSLEQLQKIKNQKLQQLKEIPKIIKEKVQQTMQELKEQAKQKIQNMLQTIKNLPKNLQLKRLKKEKQKLQEKQEKQNLYITKEDYFFMDKFALGLTLFIFIIKIYITIKNQTSGIFSSSEKLKKIKLEIKSVSPYILELFKPPI